LQENCHSCEEQFQIGSMELKVKEKQVQSINDSIQHFQGTQVPDELQKSIKYELVHLHHLEKKRKKYKRQIDAIDVQLTCIRSLKENMTTLIKKNETKLQEISIRWVTIQSLLDLVNSKLHPSNLEESADSYINWLKDQKQKMIYCMCEYDAAQELILYRQLDGMKNILHHSVQIYELIIIIIDFLKLEIGWESERIGLELQILSNEENVDDVHFCVDRINNLCYTAGGTRRIHHLCAISENFLDEDNELNCYCSSICMHS